MSGRSYSLRRRLLLWLLVALLTIAALASLDTWREAVATSNTVSDRVLAGSVLAIAERVIVTEDGALEVDARRRREPGRPGAILAAGSAEPRGDYARRERLPRHRFPPACYAPGSAGGPPASSHDELSSLVTRRLTGRSTLHVFRVAPWGHEGPR